MFSPEFWEGFEKGAYSFDTIDILALCFIGIVSILFATCILSEFDFFENIGKFFKKIFTKKKNIEKKIEKEINGINKDIDKYIKQEDIISALIDALEKETSTLECGQVLDKVNKLIRKLYRLKKADVKLSNKMVIYFKDYIAILHKFNEGVDNLDEDFRKKEFADTIKKVADLTNQFSQILDKEIKEYYQQKENIGNEADILKTVLSNEDEYLKLPL